MGIKPSYFEYCDVAVIGGGVAGSSAAILLARAGLSVALFEKEAGPHHKVCSEVISGETLPLLAELGVDTRVLNSLGAVPLTQFNLHGPKYSGAVRFPTTALGLSRLALDEALLSLAADSGVRVHRAVTVRGLTEDLGGKTGSLIFETSVGRVRSQRVVIATGKTDFKSVQARSGWDNGLVGFKMHLRLKPSVLKMLRGHCEIFIFKNGYGGLSEIEGDIANFCFIVDERVAARVGGGWNNLATHIAESNWQASHFLDGAEPLFKKFVRVEDFAFGFLKKKPPQLGVFCVGDQMAVTPSLTGDGLAIAMVTALAAARAIADETRPGRLRDAASVVPYQDQMRRVLEPQVRVGLFLHRLFKSSRLSDLAALSMGRAPFFVDRLFLRSRSQIGT